MHSVVCECCVCVCVDESVLQFRTAKMKAWALRRYTRCIASQVVEDGVGRGRRAESLGANTVMHPDKLWYALIHRKILGKVHRYNEVCQHHLLCVG